MACRPAGMSDESDSEDDSYFFDDKVQRTMLITSLTENSIYLCDVKIITAEQAIGQQMVDKKWKPQSGRRRGRSS